MVSRVKSARPQERWGFLVVLLLAITLRVAWPTLTEFKFSEARLAALALELSEKGRLPLVGVPSSAGFDHSPLSVYLYVPAFLFTASPIPATVYGGLVGAAAVVLCWWLARRWPGGGQWAAFVSAALFAVSPWGVVFSRKIWQVTFVPLLTLTFIGLLISALVEGRHWRLAWAIAVYSVLVQVHPSAISLAPALLLWLILFWHHVKLLPLLIGGLTGIMTAVPFLIQQGRSGWPALVAWRSLPEAEVDLAAVRLGWDAITGRGIHVLAGQADPLLRLVPELGWAFNLVGWLTVAAVVGLAWRFATRWRSGSPELRRATRVDLILLCWLLVPLAFNLRHSLELFLHFFVLVMPAAYLIIGRAVQAAFGRPAPKDDGVQPPSRQEQRSSKVPPPPSRWVPTLKACASVLLLLLTTGQVVALVLMGHFVASHNTAGGFGTPLRHYLEVADATAVAASRHNAAEVLVVGPGDWPVVDGIPAVFDVLLRGRVAYRFVDSKTAALFPAHRAVALVVPDEGEATIWYDNPIWPRQALGHGYRLVHLNGSWPGGQFAPVPGPRLLQNGVEFQGHSWQGEAVPGGRGQLWLLWQVLWLSPADTHFFVQVMDQSEAVKGQQDTPGYPTQSRSRGDHIVSLFDITIQEGTPVGQFWAEGGQYLYPQMVNVPVIDSTGNPVADRVNLGSLTVSQDLP